jgi:taurine dioxygenase
MHVPLRPFGVEAQVDLARGLSAADKEELRRLYMRDGLLVIRDLRLNLEQQFDLCGIFGPVLRTPGETYIVSNVHKDGVFGSGELLFHNDIPYVPAPYMAGALYAVDIAGEVGATRFASGLRAYESLPPQLRECADGLNTLQVRQQAHDRRNRLTDMLPTNNCAVQSVVARQRETGRPYLFPGQWHTACVIGMSEADGDKLLEELWDYLYAPDNIYDHAWKTGDIVIWDNLAVQHARRSAGSGSRTLQRVSVGEFAYWEQYPVDRPTFDSLYTHQQNSAA